MLNDLTNICVALGWGISIEGNGFVSFSFLLIGSASRYTRYIGQPLSNVRKIGSNAFSTGKRYIYPLIDGWDDFSKKYGDDVRTSFLNEMKTMLPPEAVEKYNNVYDNTRPAIDAIKTLRDYSTWSRIGVFL